MGVLLVMHKYGYLSRINSSKKNWVIWFISSSLVILSFKYLNKTITTQYPSLNTSKVFFFVLSCLMVGLFEELLFRRLTFKIIIAKTKDKAYRSLKPIFYTSLIFAVAHSTNFFNADTFSFSVINQILFAFGIGFLFQSLYIKLNNLILIVTLHGLINIFGSYKSHLIPLRQETLESSYTLIDFWTTFGFLVVLNIIIIGTSISLLRKRKNLT